MSDNYTDQSLITKMVVRSTPPIQDLREATTIVITSLRALFGELEHYSCTMHLEQIHEKDKNTLFVIKCPKQSVAAIRASLTMVTTPHYLDNIYRFDVVEIL